MNTYISGTLVRSSASFVNSSGVPADPSTTTFKYRPGAGSTQSVTPVHDSTGLFHYDMDTTGFEGPDTELWTCQWQGTGAVVAIQTDYFGVTSPAL